MGFSLSYAMLDGAFGAVMGQVTVFPIDLVKTRLQSQQVGPNGERMYKGIIDCFRKTLRSEGFFGMYRGCAVTTLLVSPEKAVKLSVYDYCRYYLTQNKVITLERQMLAGTIAGVFQSFVCTPMEFIKIQLQTAGRTGKQSKEERLTATKFVTRLLREKGIFGLYRGLIPTMTRCVFFSLVYFPIFTLINAKGPRKGNESEDAAAWVSFCGGLVAAGCAALCMTPVDVVKTRLQLLKKAEGEKEFTGIGDCIMKTFKYEGGRAFFKGGFCRIMVLGPLYGIAQAVYYFNFSEKIFGGHRA